MRGTFHGASALALAAVRAESAIGPGGGFPDTREPSRRRGRLDGEVVMGQSLATHASPVDLNVDRLGVFRPST